MGYHDHGAFAVFQGADDLQHLAGELRVQGGGRLVKAQNIRLQGQRPGNGRPLLLPAGKLTGVAPGLGGHPYLSKQRFGLPVDGGEDLPQIGPAFKAAGLFQALPGQQLFGQGHVLLDGVLGEQIELLKNQTEVQPFFSDGLLAHGGRV